MPAPTLWTDLSRFLPQVGLLVLLVVEILFLTIAFDAQALYRAPTVWGRLLGWTPQYLRVAITALLFTSLVSGATILRTLRAAGADTCRVRPRMLAVHLCSLAIFAGVTAWVFNGNFLATPHQQAWVLAWLLTGGVTLVAWGLSAFRATTWIALARRGRTGLLWGVGGGSVALAGGFLTEDFWTPLAGYTFSVVTWMLRWIYPDIMADPVTFVVGTPAFSVDIAPTCSGLEGIGLILAFLGIYLWLFRRDFRFPAALILLPLGVTAIWFLNAARIAVLIVIGTAGWPGVALGGFHSQAGWLSFNAVGLGFVAITTRGRYFMTDAPADGHGDIAADSTQAAATAAYLGPFLAIVATSMATGAFTVGFDWFYPARVLAAGAVLWASRRHYAELQWRWSWSAIAIGAVTCVVWLALLPAGVHDKDGWPAALRVLPTGWAVLWLMLRVVGYVVIVPLAEELAFRGFLPRRLQRADFQSVPVAAVSWLPVLISSILFGALHGQLWLAGTIAGLLFAVALYRGRSLGDAVQAHATTNALLVLYVCATGRWSVWT